MNYILSKARHHCQKIPIVSFNSLITPANKKKLVKKIPKNSHDKIEEILVYFL
jgi:type III secretion system FlhB-like substrate exporter